MKKIAFISAYNPGNMGMYSVDRAIIELFGNNNRYKIFCAHPHYRHGYYSLKKLGVDIGHRHKWREGVVKKFAYAHPDQFKDYDSVVFWGDFTLNPEYGHNDFVEHDAALGISMTIDESVKRWLRLFSTVNFPETTIISFGQNFQSKSIGRGGLFFSETKKVLSKIHTVFPRDSRSAENLVHLVPSSCKIVQACDPALMKVTEYEYRKIENQFAYFFSRSNFRGKLEFIDALSESLKAEAIPLEGWIGNKNDYETRWQNYARSICDSEFVVTDTYHCAVNAIALNRVPIVISNPTTSQSGTLGDFKKRILLDDCFLSQYLFETDAQGDLSLDKRNQIIEFARKLVTSNPSDIGEMFLPMKNKAVTLRQTLFSLLET